MRSTSYAALSLLFSLLFGNVAHAHFSFIVPSDDGQSARIIMAETLDESEAISVQFLGNMTLFARNGTDEPRALTTTAIDKRALRIETRGSGTRVIYGRADLGVMGHGSAPHHLIYHPKTIVGNPYDHATHLGKAVPLELIPVRSSDADQFRVQLVANGQALTESEVTLILPDGNTEVMVTDDAGMTRAFDAVGRYAAWARHWHDTPGELDGKAFEQVRHYATLVFDADGDRSVHADSATAAMETRVEKWIDLPIATASFGAVASRGWLYLYGGHTAVPHEYHTSSSSGGFWRLDLTAPSEWQQLPGDVALQGMNLAAIDGLIYRAGGMRSLNAEGEPADNRSSSDVAVFDPASMSWQALPPLPVPRSSHDVVAVGRTLYVLGGWEMRHSAPSQWASMMLALNMNEKNPEWQQVPQPFHRRALIAAAFGERIYVMGGFNESNKPSRRVEVYNTVTRKWSEGPDLPGRSMNGFAPAACVHDGRLLVSVGDGTMYGLTDNRNAWEPVAETTPRIVHRMAPAGSRVLVIGGAAEGDVVDLLEAVRVSQPPTTVSENNSHMVSSDNKNELGTRDDVVATAVDSKKADKEPTTQSTPTVQDEVASGGTASKSPIAMGQSVCPIMTSKPIDGDSPVAMYRGRPVAVCCETCLTKWDRNADGYAAVAALPQLDGLKIPQRKIEQVFCPVYRTRVVTSADPTVEYEGQTIYLFNRSAVRRWNENPQKYADVALLPQLRQNSQEKTVARSDD